ncbi:MAG: archaetidylserine decarboxylase [Pseudobdellovibrionaceae bacterium]
MQFLNYLLFLVPKNILSRFVGWLVHLELPEPLKTKVLLGFAGYYKINLDEAEKTHQEYKSIGALFTRKLKRGIRPVGSAECLHPADSKLTTFGSIDGNTLLQAKGHAYSLPEFIKDPNAATRFRGGYFATYYLCPTDYHRVHSPVAGEVTKATVVPGALWPVNNWSVNAIHNLFALNERVVVEIKTRYGDVIVVLVGATNVGKMSLAFDSEVGSNQGGSTRTREYHPPIKLEKGDELGTFHMGSTVVVIYSPEFVRNFDFSKKDPNEFVKVNASFFT